MTMIMLLVESMNGFHGAASAPVSEATAIAPNATWDSPSPMNEKRLSTSVTPRSEAHSATSTPTISALRTCENCR